ncbi:MAG: hypothetical protein RIS29_102, partial [Bacteroidota bacterium]
MQKIIYKEFRQPFLIEYFHIELEYNLTILNLILMDNRLNEDLQRLIEQTIRGNRPVAFNKDSTNEELLSELSIYYRELEFQNDELRTTQANLEASQAELLDLFESAPVGYVLYDEENVIVNSNRYFEMLTAKSKKELNGRKLNSIISPQSQDEYYLHHRNIQLNKENKSTEFIIRRLNTDVFVKVETNLKIRHEKPLFMSAFTDINLQKLAESELKLSQSEMKMFAIHIQRVREEERTGLSREIHDELGQILIAMKIELGLLKQSTLKLIDPIHYEEEKNKFIAIQELVDNTITSARRIMTDLRPEVLDMLGFNDTVSQYIRKYEDRYKIKCVYVNNGTFPPLDSQ